MRRLIMLVSFVALIATACSSGDTGTTTDTGLPDNPDRCEELDPLALDYLRTGIIVDDVTLPWGFSVKSTDYDDVWIVTAAVEIPDDIDYGTWAIRAAVWPTEYIGAVAVDEIAKRVSSFGDDSSVIVTASTDGVLSAQACAIARLDNS